MGLVSLDGRSGVPESLREFVNHIYAKGMKGRRTKNILIDGRDVLIPDLSPHVSTSTFAHVKAPFTHKTPKMESLPLLVRYHGNVEV